MVNILTLVVFVLILVLWNDSLSNKAVVLLMSCQATAFWRGSGVTTHNWAKSSCPILQTLIISKLSSSVFENFKCFRCLHLGLWGLHQTRHNFEGLYMPKLNVILYTGVNKELEVSCLDLFCAIILIVNRTQTRTSQVLGILHCLFQYLYFCLP